MSNILLARLLLPELFGLTALTGALMAGLQMFSDIGLLPAMIRSHRGEEPAFRNTAWTLGVLRGTALWACAGILAFPAAWLYDRRLLVLMPVVGVGALLASLGSTSYAVLSRRMDLRAITLLDMGCTGSGLVVTCLWAWRSPTVWAIVGGSLFGITLRMCGTWFLLPSHRDRFQWEKPAVQEILTFGRWIFVSTAITFGAMQLDRLLLGRLMPLEKLGVYSITLSLISMPRELVSRLASAVQYPMLARCVREYPERMEVELERTRGPMLLLAMWGTLAIALGAQGFFSLLYNAKYGVAIQMARLLSVPMVVWAFSMTADRVLLAAGDSRALAATNFARTVALVPACLGGYALWGVAGFIGGMAASALAGHIVLLWALRRHGVHVIAHDLAYLAGYAVCLGGPLLLADRLVHLGTIHGVDLGLATCGAAVLIPLGIVAAFRMRALIRP